MRHARRAVRHARSDRNNLDVRLVIRNAISDLFETTQRREISDRIRENRFALERHARRNRRHVLLRDARVDELIGMFFSKAVEHAEAEIARQQKNVPIRRSQPVESIDERIPH